MISSVKLKLRIRKFMYRLKQYNMSLIILSILIGVFGGLGAVVFREMISIIRETFFMRIFGDYLFISPMVGAILVGLLVENLAAEAKGHGIPQIIESVRYKFGLMRKRVAAVEILAASITIASGGSAGREGPIAQIGAGIASSMAQILRLRPKDVRLLVTSGLVAGISATFNAPIGALIFGLEILSPEIDASRLINLLLASVTGKIVATQFLGDYPAFYIPYTIVFSNIVEILFVALLGVVIGLLGAIWVLVFDKFETWVDEVKLPLYVKTGIFGLIVGLIGFQFVEYGILGVGYEAVDSFFMGKITLMSLLFFIAFMKMIATLFTVGSGTTGGIFAPSLVIGTFLGAGLGVLFEKLFPNIISDPNLYALVGMAAYFTAVAKVPLTTLVMIPEMTRSYTIFVPIMVANAISYVMSLVILGRESIYTLKLNRIMRKKEFVKI